MDFPQVISFTITNKCNLHCQMCGHLIDIQPNGDANFCVDFIDYSFGNVRQASIGEVWRSKMAEHFRAYRRQKSLPVCLRCGA